MPPTRDNPPQATQSGGSNIRNQKVRTAVTADHTNKRRRTSFDYLSHAPSRDCFHPELPPGSDDRRPRPVEAVARATLETCMDRTLTDAEWVVDRARILEFVSILRVWDRETVAPRRGNLEVLCQ